MKSIPVIMALNTDLKASTLLPETPNHEKETRNNFTDISASISSSDLEKTAANTNESLSIDPNLVSNPMTKVFKN
jgi:hypothetical protein